MLILVLFIPSLYIIIISILLYKNSILAGLLSREAAKCTENFVFTVGVGDDFVMRLGVDSIENLRTCVLETLRACKLPKVRFTHILNNICENIANLFKG